MCEQYLRRGRRVDVYGKRLAATALCTGDTLAHPAVRAARETARNAGAAAVRRRKKP